ncbi:homocysteine S-methyltransferase, partial [archaeon]
MYRNCLRDVLGYKEGERAFFLSETGLETTLLFKEGIDIPCFASFPLLKSNPEVLKKFLEEHVLCAVKYNANFILDSAGWRANADWGQKLGLSTHELDDFNRLSIKLLSDIRDKYQRSGMTMVISGVVGPRSDGYSPQLLMTAEQARNYHRHQISVYKDTTADLVTAYTMCYVQEPLGIVQAAKEMGMPVVISFTLEFDGTLPSGMSLQDAIETIDRATDSYPLYYMINCAHPTHFMHVLQEAHAQGGEEGE